MTFALSLAAVLVVDDERRVRATSNVASALLTRDREELLGRPIDDCLSPESRARLRTAWPGCVRAGSWVLEVAILRTDGSLRLVMLSATANVLPGFHMVTFDHDPDHRRAEEDLEQLFADSPDLLIVAGSDGYLTRVNPACERTLGFSRDELLARPFLDRIHPEDLATTIDMLERLRNGALRSTITHRLRCRDGAYCAIEWHVVRARWLTGVGRVVPLPPDGAPGPSRVRGAVGDLPADRDEALLEEWLGDEPYRGIEPSLVWAIDQQLHVLDSVTLNSPGSRAAAVRCALALRQALVEMGTIVVDLRPPPTLADPAGGEADAQRWRGRASHASVAAELTERELEVIRLVAQGHDNRMIGGELFLAEVTVKKHVQHIMGKLGATSRIQAAIAAIRLGLDR